MEGNTFNTSLCFLISASLILITSNLYSQTVLDEYIREGLKNNRVLQQKNISLQQAENALKIAQSYFLPSVNLLADYTSGEGGRSISLPMGDLLNPVYRSLNDLTGSNTLPEVSNVTQHFFPHNFYDVRIRTTVPIINTNLYLNRTMQGQQVRMKELELNTYRRQLVYEIKISYFNYLASIAAVKTYQSAAVLVKKNVEINESLVKNGKGLPANLFRSRSEAERVKAELISAQNKVVNARRYFNFLVNRDLDSEIEEGYPVIDTPLIDTLTDGVSFREELVMIKTSLSIHQTSLRMSQLNRLPKINAFLDLGSQASNWEYNEKSRYYLVRVQLSLPLFQGLRNNITILQNKLEIQKAGLSLANTTDQLQLAVTVAKNDLQTTIENFHAARAQLKSAQSYFNLIDKGYQQGVNTLIEFLDARNQLTTSELQLNLRSFETLIAYARLEREVATYPLEK